MIVWQAHPDLYVGSVPRRQTHMEELRELGVETILTVAGPPLPEELTRGFKTAYHKMSDGKKLDPELKYWSEWLAHAWVNTADDKAVFVHCIAGRNRSALVAAFARHWVTRDAGTVILKDFDERRAGVLHNQVFRDHVKALVGTTYQTQYQEDNWGPLY